MFPVEAESLEPQLAEDKAMRIVMSFFIDVYEGLGITVYISFKRTGMRLVAEAQHSYGYIAGRRPEFDGGAVRFCRVTDTGASRGAGPTGAILS